MTDVFISYKREEREAITTMVGRLRALKIDVWFDGQHSDRPGFDEEIAQHLRAAPCVLVCWTPAAIASEWVRGEAALAHGDGKPVACLLEPTRLLLPPFTLQETEDLMRWAGQDDAPGWLRLLAVIGERLQRPGLAGWTAVMQPTAPLQAPRDRLAAYVDDPLANTVPARLSLLEGEAARGLRDPAEQRRRLLALSGVLVPFWHWPRPVASATRWARSAAASALGGSSGPTGVAWAGAARAAGADPTGPIPRRGTRRLRCSHGRSGRGLQVQGANRESLLIAGTPR